MKKRITLNNSLKLVTLFTLSFALVACSSNPSAPEKDGSPVVYESEFGQVSQKEYFESLNSGNSDIYIYALFEKDLLSSFEKDESIKEAAKTQTASVLENSDEENTEGMKNELIAMGYGGLDGMQEFFENMIYRDGVSAAYVNENLDDVFESYYEDYSPRVVSHILLKVDDVNSVTKEEQAELDSVRSRILNGEDFATVAKEVSDDTSKDDGGMLGLMDKNTRFVQPFLDAALAQEKGQIADWVKSDYGFHLILVNETDPEALKKEESIVTQIIQSSPEISRTVMYKIMDDADLEFLDEAFETRLRKIIESVG